MELAGVRGVVDDVAARAGAIVRASDDSRRLVAAQAADAPLADAHAVAGVSALGELPPVATDPGAMAELVLRGPIDTLGVAQLQDVGAFLRGGGRLPGTELVAHAGLEKTLEHTVQALTWGSSRADELVRYRDQLVRVRAVAALEGRSLSERTAEAAALLDRGDASTLDPEEVRRLGALLDADVERTLPLPRTMAGTDTLASVFTELRTGSADATAKLQRYLDAWHVAKEPAAQRAAEVEQLMRIPPAELAPRQVDRLAMLLDVDLAGAVPGPRTMGASTLRSTLDELMRSVPAETAALERTQAAFARYVPERGEAAIAHLRGRLSEPKPAYFDSEAQWRAYLRDDVAGAERTHELLRRAPASLEPGELAMLREQLGRRRPMWAPDQAGWDEARAALDALGPIRETVALYRRVLGTFQEAWALAREPIDARVAEAGTLLSSSPGELRPEQWRRLRLLLAADTTGAIPVAREIDGSQRLDRLVGYLQGSSEHLGEVRPYFGAWRASQLAPTERVAHVERILATPMASIADDEVDLLRAVLDAGDGGDLGLPAQLPGRMGLGATIRELQRRGDPDGILRARLQEYVDARTLGRVSREERLAEARALLDQGTPLSPSQAARLRSLLVTTGARTEYPGTQVLGSDDQVLRVLDDVAFAHEDTLAGRQAELQRQLAAYRLRDEPIESIASRAAAALELPPEERSARVVAELGAIASMPEAEQVMDLVPAAAKLELAHALQAHGSLSPHRIADGLAASRAALAGSLAAVPDAVRPLAARALDRIDGELGRMRGTPRPGLVTGYADYPDYAELGGIAADLQTIAAVARAERATSTPAAMLTW